MILKYFLEHELINMLKSKRIFLTVIMFLILFASIFIVRVVNYQKQINEYLSEVMLAEDAMKNLPNYSHINPKAINRPLVFSIYNQGFQFNRVISILFFEAIENSESINEGVNLVYFGKNNIDITFLITFFLSLFILLISYDSVNGEKKTGTLRLLMTYPIKRQSFILKKMLGVFIFVSFTFTFPFALSLFILLFMYGSLLTGSFFLSAFFYWFLVLLFIFFFCMLGIFLSVCTTSPDRSLVFSLLTWMLLSIILPICWENIISRKLYANQLNHLKRTVIDRRLIAEEIHSNFEWDGNIVHITGNSRNTNKVELFSFTRMYQMHYRLQRYLYDFMSPAIFDVETAADNIQRKLINIENTKNRIFFFNPIVLFQNMSNLIAGNSRSDYLSFLSDGRSIRNDLTGTGVKEGWLFDYRYFAMYDDENLMWDEDVFWHKYMTIDIEELSQELSMLLENAKKFSFDLPAIRRYEQPNLSFGEIFNKIIEVLALLIASILALLIITWYKFMRYDVR